MASQGDHWSQTTLKGKDIWDCLESNNIDPLHPQMQWKPAAEQTHRVSLHPIPTLGSVQNSPSVTPRER